MEGTERGGISTPTRARGGSHQPSARGCQWSDASGMRSVGCHWSRRAGTCHCDNTTTARRNHPVERRVEEQLRRKATGTAVDSNPIITHYGRQALQAGCAFGWAQQAQSVQQSGRSQGHGGKRAKPSRLLPSGSDCDWNRRVCRTRLRGCLSLEHEGWRLAGRPPVPPQHHRLHGRGGGLRLGWTFRSSGGVSQDTSSSFPRLYPWRSVLCRGRDAHDGLWCHSRDLRALLAAVSAMSAPPAQVPSGLRRSGRV